MDKIQKVRLKEIIDKRDKYMRKLRVTDYKKFEWILDRLNIIHKVFGYVKYFKTGLKTYKILKCIIFLELSFWVKIERKSTLCMTKLKSIHSTAALTTKICISATLYLFSIILSDEKLIYFRISPSV